MPTLNDDFWDWQEAFNPSQYLLALSGGLDSVVLLHLLIQEREKLTAPIDVCHVNHGWAEEANHWALFCSNLCAHYCIPFSLVHLDLSATSDSGREAQARLARYNALRKRLRLRGVLLTAHHEDDQAETFLLQLFRGAGVAGLAAMPSRKVFGQGEHWRPLLSYSRESLHAYAIKNDLHWIDDPSNADIRYKRNFLRHKVMPVINEGFSNAGHQIARSVNWLAETKVLLDEAADAYLEDDILAVLDWDKVKEISAEWQKTVIRRWLQRQGLRVPGHLRLEELLRQIREGSGYAELVYDGVVVFYYRGKLAVIENIEPKEAPEFNNITDWVGVGRLIAKMGKGMYDHEWLWSLYPPGANFQPAGATHHKPLKDWFQRAGIPPLIRRRTPLLWCNGELAWVGGIGVAEKFEGLVIDWQKIPFSANIAPTLQASD